MCKNITISLFFSLFIFALSTSIYSIDTTKIKGAEDFIYLSEIESNCIYASHRIGGVCTGPTTRLCQGPPACQHPPKEDH